jgi:hypothetical protein
MYSRVEEERLGFVRRGLSNAQNNTEDKDNDNNTFDLELPASFLGSRKWASEQMADSLALACTYGKPSLFITMTCNPKWPEIQARLKPGQKPVCLRRWMANPWLRHHYEITEREMLTSPCTWRSRRPIHQR